jgi:hypothetical protein
VHNVKEIVAQNKSHHRRKLKDRRIPWINKLVSEPPHPTQHVRSELFLFLEEHREADDSSVDQKTTENRHNHGGDLDLSAVRKDNGERCNLTMLASGVVPTEENDHNKS